MMSFVFLSPHRAASSVVGLLFFVLSLSIYYRRKLPRRERALAEAWGCRAPRDYPLLDKVFGLDFLFKSMKLVRSYQNVPAPVSYHKDHGNTFRLTLRGKAVFYTISPENLRAIYETQCSDWGVEPHRLKAMRPFCGIGHITSDGKDWERADAILKPSLALSNVHDLTAFGSAASDFINNLPASSETVDMSPILDEFFFDMGIHFLLGQRFKQLVSEKHVEVPDTQTFLEALHVSQFWANIRVFFGLMGRLCSILMWRSSCNIVHRFVDHYISVALQEVPPTQHPTLNKESRSTITQNQRSLIVGLAMNTGDRTEMRWQVIQNLILMQDTTSTLVSNTLFLLSRNPASWASLRTEVLELKFDTLSAPVLTELTFLRNIFKESLRLFPILGQSGRTALRTTMLPVGGGPDGSAPIFVPPGSITMNNFYALHRQTAVFGKDVESFNPDRWDRIFPGPCEFMPFGHGQRRCAGEHKALLEASYLVAKLALRFARLESRDDRNWAGDWKLVVRNLNGCKIAFIRE